MCCVLRNFKINENYEIESVDASKVSKIHAKLRLPFKSHASACMDQL